jgi:hypothetical protein
MAGRIAAPLDLTTEQRQDLTALSWAHSTPQKLAEGARIVLLAADGVSVSETARRLCWKPGRPPSHSALLAPPRSNAILSPS